MDTTVFKFQQPPFLARKLWLRRQPATLPAAQPRFALDNGFRPPYFSFMQQEEPWMG
jgi:hypothetical protein